MCRRRRSEGWSGGGVDVVVVVCEWTEEKFLEGDLYHGEGSTGSKRSEKKACNCSEGRSKCKDICMVCVGRI